MTALCKKLAKCHGHAGVYATSGVYASCFHQFQPTSMENVRPKYHFLLTRLKFYTDLFFLQGYHWRHLLPEILFWKFNPIWLHIKNNWSYHLHYAGFSLLFPSYWVFSYCVLFYRDYEKWKSHFIDANVVHKSRNLYARSFLLLLPNW